MAFVIKQRQVVADSWQLLKPAADGSPSSVPPAGDVIVPLAFWLERREAPAVPRRTARGVARQP